MNVAGTLSLLLALVIGVVLLFFTTLRNVGFSVIAFTVCIIAFFVWQSHQRSVGFESVSLGADASAVISLLGSPPRITDGTEWVEEGFKRSEAELVPGCTKEFWYASFLYPEQLSFCFDANGKLVKKYRWLSW